MRAKAVGVAVGGGAVKWCSGPVGRSEHIGDLRSGSLERMVAPVRHQRQKLFPKLIAHKSKTLTHAIMMPMRLLTMIPRGLQRLNPSRLTRPAEIANPCPQSINAICADFEAFSLTGSCGPRFRRTKTKELTVRKMQSQDAATKGQTIR